MSLGDKARTARRKARDLAHHPHFHHVHNVAHLAYLSAFVAEHGFLSIRTLIGCALIGLAVVQLASGDHA